MAFLFPWSLLGLVLVPAVLLWGLLAPRGRRIVVGSLLLWRRALGTGPAGGAKVRLRLRNPILWVDAGLVLVLVLACARPALRSEAHTEPVAVFVLDCTASRVGADDGLRPEAVIRTGLLPESAESAPVRVVAVPPVGPNASSPALLRGDLADHFATVLAEGDLRPVAASEAVREPGRPVLVLTDVPPRGTLPANVYVAASGRSSRNAGLVRVTTRIEGGRWWLLVAAKAAPEARGPWALRVEAPGRGVAEVPGFLSAAGTTEKVLAMPGPPPERLTVRLQGPDDGFPFDNAAWLTLDAARRVRVVPVGEPGEYVRRALSAVEGVQLFEAGDSGDAAADAADLLVVAGQGVPPEWSGPAVLVTPPEVPGRLRPTTEETAPIWRVAADHPLAEGLYLPGPAMRPVRRYELSEGVRVAVGTPEAPLIVTWDADGAKRLAVLFPQDREASDWPTRTGFPVFWSRAVEWLAPERTAEPRHVSYRPYEVLPEGGLAPGATGFKEVAGRTIGVSFIGSDEGFEVGPRRDETEAFAGAVRRWAEGRMRGASAELWPLFAVLALGLLLARAWVAR